jgi:hypothetical protein
VDTDIEKLQLERPLNLYTLISTLVPQNYGLTLSAQMPTIRPFAIRFLVTTLANHLLLWTKMQRLRFNMGQEMLMGNIIKILSALLVSRNV